MAHAKPQRTADHAAARADHNAEWDADDDDRPPGDPAKLKDEGPLKSLGKAVSSPLLNSDGDDRPAAGETALRPQHKTR